MTTTSRGPSDASGVEWINERIEQHKPLAIFFGIEACLILGGLIANAMTISIEEGAPVLSHVIAGLFGSFAVIWLLIGAVTYGILLVSNLYMRYQRAM